MKNLITILLFTSVIFFTFCRETKEKTLTVLEEAKEDAVSKTKYYTTNGKNRLTESEVKKMLSEEVDKMKKLLDMELYGSLTIEEIKVKIDSIINTVTLDISAKKKENFINSAPLSEYKGKEFPKFDLNTLTDKNFNSEQLKGKPTMINFWFTKCAPVSFP